MGRTSAPAVARRAGGLGLRDRHREQRKRIIKMCVQKLRDIDDPETVLCRAVLINNTFRTLKTAQRRLLKNARRRMERRDSSEEEQEEREELEETSRPLKQEEQDRYVPPEEELEELADLGSCSDAALVVHSLVMPPLLSPHIEDMTNCSFYDSFGPVDLGEGETKAEQDQDMSANLKLTMMKSDLCDVIGEKNSNSSSKGRFSKTEFGTCGGQGTEKSDQLLDNLLTEIAQA